MGPLEAALLLACLASAAYCVISAYCLSGVLSGPEKTSSVAPKPAMTVMKPVRGADGDTFENLRSFVLQDYPDFQVLFGVPEHSDPAVPIIRRIIAGHPELDLELVVSGEPKGANLKVANLVHMFPRARHDIIVIADADMRVGRDYLGAVAAGFDGPSVGLVTCPYRGAYPESIGAALEALTINTDFLPSVAVADRLEGLSFALGATMAVRRDALEAIGGFETLSDYLADDYQLGNRVKKAGYGIVLSDYVVDSVGRSESVPGFFAHQLRWGRTYRVSRPGGYFMSGITRLTAISIVFLIASGFSALGWQVLAAGVALRYAQAIYVESVLVRGPGVLGYIWVLPLRDIIGFVIWVLSFTGNRVSWKDETFEIQKDGRMLRC